MKNKVVKVLLSTMIVYLCAPIANVYGDKNGSLYAGVVKDIGDSLEDSQIGINNQQYTMFTTANVNIRSSPSLDAEILSVIPFNSEISVFDYNEEWSVYLYKPDESNVSKIAYINRKYISVGQCESVTHNFPRNKGFKSFMPYTSITHTSSPQYKLQDKMAYTGDFGIRKINERYCIAIGTAFDIKIGTYIDLILENGVVIEGIVSDVKAGQDTLSDNITTAQNGCVSEFIIDLDSLKFEARRDGDISSCCLEWGSPVKEMKVYDKNIFE